MEKITVSETLILAFIPAPIRGLSKEVTGPKGAHPCHTNTTSVEAKQEKEISSVPVCQILQEKAHTQQDQAGAADL